MGRAAVPGDIYRRLMAGAGPADPVDRHLFASMLTIALCDPTRSLAAGLGLAPEALNALLARYFPKTGLAADGDGEPCLALEEDDLRRLLIENSTAGTQEQTWFAHIVARRSLGPNHLWQDLGFESRAELSELMQRHFRPLALRNDRDMKWKKFFYRELCGMENVPVCKSPVCDDCTDFSQCFGGEDGLSLLAQLERTHPC